jgi:hypothetical protein
LDGLNGRRSNQQSQKMSADSAPPLPDEFGDLPVVHCRDLGETNAIFSDDTKRDVGTVAGFCSGLHACPHVTARVSNAGAYPACAVRCVLNFEHAGDQTIKDAVIAEKERLEVEWNDAADPMATLSKGKPKGSYLRLCLYRFSHNLLHPRSCGHQGASNRVIKPICIMALITMLCGASEVGYKVAAPKNKEFDGPKETQKRGKKSKK